MSDYLAFDFDGVICESANESGLTAWRGAHGLWPGQVPAAAPEDFMATFHALRPVIETGHEIVVVVGLLAEGRDPGAILENFHALRDEFKAARGVDDDAMRDAFGAARDAWIAEHPAGWLAAQGFYPGVVEAINACRTPRCIITTKEERFTRLLVEHAGIAVAPERIYALESFEGRGKRSVIEALRAEFPAHRLHFFEDWMKTLDAMRASNLAQLYLVDWGYNTPEERAAAARDPRISLIGLAQFQHILARGG